MVAILVTCASHAQASSGELRKIRIGDGIRLVASSRAFLLERSVLRSGSIELPQVGPIAVVGMAPADALEKIASVAGRRFPADLSLAVFGGPKTPIWFQDGRNAPVEVAFRPGLTVSQLLSRQVVDPDSDVAASSIQRIDGATLPAADGTLRPGDTLIVPARARTQEVYLLGAVQRPGAVPHRAGLTVGEAIQVAGGLSGRADTKRAEIRSAGTSIPIDLGQESSRILRSGETVFVPVEPETAFVSVGGGVLQPGIVPFAANMTLLDAVENAGGLLRPVRAKVIVTPKGGKPSTFDLDDVRRGRKPNPVLKPFDVLEVELFTHPASGESKGGG
ncbi:MAG: SLBB domain-containing protein [Fimbriimonas sp.]